MVVAPSGDVLDEADESDGPVVSAGISRSLLDEVRSTNPSLVNRRM
jgi:hypothetical protein